MTNYTKPQQSDRPDCDPNYLDNCDWCGSESAFGLIKTDTKTFASKKQKIIEEWLCPFCYEITSGEAIHYGDDRTLTASESHQCFNILGRLLRYNT